MFVTRPRYDLVYWKKYPNNPIVAGNKDSGILVHDGSVYRLYMMKHPYMTVYFPRDYEVK